jgi:hypothetical protein
MTTDNTNWADVKTKWLGDLQASIHLNKQEKFIEMQRKRIQLEIQNQKDMRSDFIYLLSGYFTSEQNQEMMLYFDRNIAYFENLLKEINK